jgi:hypothetical protein
MTVTGALLIGLLTSVASIAAPPLASAQQLQKPNVVFVLADNVGYGDLGHTAAVSCGALRRRVWTSWLTKECVSRSSWSSRPAPHRERRC